MTKVKLTVRSRIVTIISAMHRVDQIEVKAFDTKFDHFQVSIVHPNGVRALHAVAYEFKWTNQGENPKYIGYEINSHLQGSSDRAKICISSPAEATDFVTAFRLLTKLRAKKRN